MSKCTGYASLMARINGGVLITWLKSVAVRRLMRRDHGGVPDTGKPRRLSPVAFVSLLTSMLRVGRSAHTLTRTATTSCQGWCRRRKALPPSRTMILNIVRSEPCGVRIVVFVEVIGDVMSVGTVTQIRSVRHSCRTRRRRQFG